MSRGMQMALVAAAACGRPTAAAPSPNARALAADHATSCAVANEGEEIVFDCGGELSEDFTFIFFAADGRGRKAWPRPRAWTVDLDRAPLALRLDSHTLAVSAVDFGSFGRPTGTCDEGSRLEIDRSCHARDSIASLEDRCLGQSTCLFTVRSEVGLLLAALPLEPLIGGATTCWP